ncbi:hypothetical protein [Mucilaginibacter panaciglaebae]|uniref:DKNYY family protein n=1 Tax=Mucilaginibacter panaciglaebae TaxID=502331 RepID=A0ABP7WT33_9SPHI
MSTAIVRDNAIKVLQKTLFPTGMRYAISADGMAACLDKERKLIIYGQLLADGSFAFYKLVDFPEMISPKSLAVIKNHIVLGGENNLSFGNNIRSRELVATYNLLSGQFTALEMPFQKSGKCVDDLLLNGDSVIAVDNIVYPYILTYDFKDPYAPCLVNTLQLPNNGTYKTIKKGSMSATYLALLSSTHGDAGGGKYINIFRTGNYQDYIRLEKSFGWETKSGKYNWSDILIIDNFLCIAAREDGIGLFKIEEFPGAGAPIIDRSSEVQYAEQDYKKVRYISLNLDQYATTHNKGGRARTQDFVSARQTGLSGERR